MEYDTVMHMVQARVNALVQKGLGLRETEAVAKVFRDDPALYRQYREAAGRQPARSHADAPARRSPTPSGAEVEALRKAESLVQKQAGLTPTEALSRVFADDPDLYARYRQGERTDVAQVAKAAPVSETRAPQHPLAGELLALAKAFRPDDPTGEGMLQVRQALGLLQQTVERKKRAAA
jgi:hypothetical protein